MVRVYRLVHYSPPTRDRGASSFPDNYFIGCEFSQNAYGVQAYAGNVYVTLSRFIENNASDGSITAHANSYRWVVSVNSTAFLTTLPGNGGGSPTKLQGVIVQGWGAANASSPAVYMGPRGPMQVIDSTFSNAAFPSSPALSFGGGGSGIQEALLLSNASAAPGPLLDPESGGNITHTTRVGPGSPAVRARLPSLSATTQFLSAVWAAPGKVFDAVVDFGADPSGRNVSSGALQLCVDAAASAANGAVCYLPSGVYKVNETLRVCGADWTMLGSGSGFTTIIHWDPAANSSLPAVTMASGPGAGCAATNLTIARLNLFTPGSWSGGQVDFAVSRSPTLPPSPTCRWGLTGICVAVPLPHFVESEAPVQLRLDALYFSSAGGTVLNALKDGDVLFGPLWDGNLVIFDSDGATIVPSFFSPESAGVAVVRTLPTPVAGSGVAGAACLVTASNVYDVWAFNSSSFAAADWYTETSHSAVYLEGDGSSAPGTLALSSAKLNTNAPLWGALVSNDYAGTVLMTGAVASYSPYNVTLSGRARLDLAIAANSLWANSSEAFNSNPAAVVHRTANVIVQGGFDAEQVFPDTPAVLAAGYDALRRLSIAHISLNFPALATWP